MWKNCASLKEAPLILVVKTRNEIGRSMGIDNTKTEIARRDDSPTGSFKDDNLYRDLIYDTYYRQSLRRIHPQREMTNSSSRLSNYHQSLLFISFIK